MGRVK